MQRTPPAEPLGGSSQRGMRESVLGPHDEGRYGGQMQGYDRLDYGARTTGTNTTDLLLGRALGAPS